MQQTPLAVRRVELGKIRERACAGEQNKIIDRRNHIFAALSQTAPRSNHCVHIDVHRHVEMRRRLLAKGHALADDAAHRRKGRNRRIRCLLRANWRCTRSHAQNIGRQDAAFRSAAGDVG